MRAFAVVAMVWVAGCVDASGDDPSGPGGKTDRTDDPPPAAATTDVVSTSLVVDVDALTGVATIRARAGDDGVVLEAGGLSITAVTGPNGPLPFTHDDGVLAIDAVGDVEVDVEYELEVHRAQEGLLHNGSTLTWPYHCGNLFPCRSAPSDGGRFELDLAGIPTGETAVFPARIAGDAPSYQLAWAVGDYQRAELGTTTAGTRVSVYWLPGGEASARAGTRDLVGVVDWLETTLGPYTFGDEVGSVAVDWGAGAFGGMEHHPLWHVAADAMGDAETQAHEAAHGWFGDGVRIQCWEDFVLSEGTVSYLAARALGQVAGADAEAAIWRDYEDRLRSAGKLVWPEGCDDIDIIEDGLFSDAPYMRGAFFLRAVADEVGADTLDGVLGRFYRAHAGTAVGMQDLIDAIERDTGIDAAPLVREWLRPE